MISTLPPCFSGAGGRAAVGEFRFSKENKVQLVK